MLAPSQAPHYHADMTGRHAPELPSPHPVIEVVRPSARRISVRIDPARRAAIVTAPSKRDLPRARRFAAERADWIAQRLAALPRPMPFRPGAMIELEGEPVRLLAAEGRTGVRREPGALTVGAAPGRFAAAARKALVALARERIESAVARHAERLGVSIAGVSLRDTRSRWGSCSAAGALSFSWRLIAAPPAVLDYVAAHETAHRLEMNHSARFWAHVRACVGDPAGARRWLRANGSRLLALGALEAACEDNAQTFV
jgi:predicted metal-dependent hydrolase